MVDQVMVGGETHGRGLITGKRENRSSWIGMGISVGAILVFLVLTEMQTWSLIVAIVLGLAAFLAWSEYESLDNQSPPVWVVDRVWDRYSQRTGTAKFRPRRLIPADERPIINAAGKLSTEAKEAQRTKPITPKPAKQRKAQRRARVTEVHQRTGLGADVPPAVGHIEPLVLPLNNGENVCFIRHYTRDNGGAGYLSVMLEKAAAKTGVIDTGGAGLSGDAWGQWCASLAGHSTFVSSVQETARVVPWDYSDHRAWVLAKFDPESPEPVRASYAELMGAVHREAEQHRHWVTLRIPRTAMWQVHAMKYGVGARAEMLAAWDQTKAAIEAGKARGIALRALGERRSAAVIRALQDPDVPIDRNEDVDWSSCWLEYDGHPTDRVIFSGARRDWHTATARVPKGGWSPGWLPVDFLRPLITGVSPAVVRTLNVTQHLHPPGTARKQARLDVASDVIMLRKSRDRVTDGAEETQTTASKQRLTDLRPGMGAAGSDFTFGMTFQSPSDDDFAEQHRIMSAAAEESEITRLKWMNRRHRDAWVSTLPLGRGVRGKG